jgi:hypothetical protein
LPVITGAPPLSTDRNGPYDSLGRMWVGVRYNDGVRSATTFSRPLLLAHRRHGSSSWDHVRVHEVSDDGLTITVPTQARYQLEILDTVVAYPVAALHEHCEIPGCMGAPHLFEPGEEEAKIVDVDWVAGRVTLDRPWPGVVGDVVGGRWTVPTDLHVGTSYRHVVLKPPAWLNTPMRAPRWARVAGHEKARKNGEVGYGQPGAEGDAALSLLAS